MSEEGAVQFFSVDSFSLFSSYFSGVEQTKTKKKTRVLFFPAVCVVCCVVWLLLLFTGIQFDAVSGSFRTILKTVEQTESSRIRKRIILKCSILPLLYFACCSAAWQQHLTCLPAVLEMGP